MSSSPILTKNTPHDFTSLANHFLIAMPGMLDPLFSGSVIYLLEHNPEGAMGLVINRPTDIDLGGLFDKIGLSLEIQILQDQPVYFGGPVQTDRGFVLHDPVTSETYSSSLRVPHGLALTTSKDILESVSHGVGPEHFVMTLGYSGWSAGQLEDELANNGWLSVPAHHEQLIDIIFKSSNESKYDKVMGLLGIDPQFLSDQTGHA